MNPSRWIRFKKARSFLSDFRSDCIFRGQMLCSWVLHDLLKNVQNVQHTLTFQSFLLILGHIKSRPMKRDVMW